MRWAKDLLRRIILTLGFFAMLLGPPASAEAAELIMFEEAGCPWCARWDSEIAAIYPKTTEGRRAPLRRVDLHSTWPEDLPDLKAVYYTPTFVLIDKGREVGRILGYPGEDFFWGLLAELIGRLDRPPGERTISDGGQ